MESVLLAGGVIMITGLIIWIGWKRLAIAVPCACGFLLFAFIAIPNVLPPRIAPAQNACVSYLKFIQNGKAEWAKRNQKLPSDIPTAEDVFSSNNPAPYQWIPRCPTGGKYKMGAVNQNPTCTCATEEHTLQ